MANLSQGSELPKNASCHIGDEAHDTVQGDPSTRHSSGRPKHTTQFRAIQAHDTVQGDPSTRHSSERSKHTTQFRAIQAHDTVQGDPRTWEADPNEPNGRRVEKEGGDGKNRPEEG